MKQQHDEAMKEIRNKASKDIKRITDERNAAMQEYALVMSERDTVHKEMEKLSEDLTQAYKKIKILENESKSYLEEVIIVHVIFFSFMFSSLINLSIVEKSIILSH